MFRTRGRASADPAPTAGSALALPPRTMAPTPTRARRQHGEHGGVPLVLVADADPALVRWLEEAEFGVVAASTAEALIDALSSSVPDLVLLDLGLPGLSGLDALRETRARHGTVPVVVLAAARQASTVVDLIREGAYDFVPKPIDRTKLLTTTRNACERHRLSIKLADLERQTRDDGFASIPGRSPQMRRLFGQMNKVAPAETSLLIRGERGTGKELVARAIHDASYRAGGPFVAVNCAAIPESTLDTELFGHEKESFTGTKAIRQGHFERASGGTLFLDGVAELSPTSQAQLVRVLREGRFERVGGAGPLRSDFRLIAATHRDVPSMLARGEYRKDLYALIAASELEVPPLRERFGDVSLLVDHLLKRAVAPGGTVPQFDDAALRMLCNHRWPGNVRELGDLIQHAVVACKNEWIRPRDLPPQMRRDASDQAANGVPQTSEFLGRSAESLGGTGERPANTRGPTSTLAELEREAIERELERWNGNVTAVGKALGIGRTTLYRRLKAYGLR